MGEALHLAYGLLLKIRETLRERKTLRTLTKEEIDHVVKTYFRKALDEDETDRILRPHPMKEAELVDHLDALSFLETDTRQELALSDYSRISRYASDLLEDNKITNGVDFGTFRTLCRELLKINIRYLLEIQQKRAVENYSFMVPLINSRETSLPPEPPRATGPPLSAIIEKFIEEQKRSGIWTDKTESEVRASLNVFLEMCGMFPLIPSTLKHAIGFGKSLSSYQRAGVKPGVNTTCRLLAWSLHLKAIRM
jgi:hypothetical protein